MQKIVQDKRAILAGAALALFSLVLLASAINKMEFQPSKPIGGGSTDQGKMQLLDAALILQTAAEIPFWKQVVFWAVLFLLLLLITSLLNPELRKQLIRAFLRFASFALILLYLMKKKPELFAGLLGQFAGLSQNLALKPGVDSSPAPVFTPPQDISWLSFAVTLAIIFLLVLLVWCVNRLLNHLREVNASHEPLADFAKIARDSIADLNAGGSYENVIVECYGRMSVVIAKKQGLQRAHEMTPSEFSARLTRAGLPPDPIQTLTSLFERVRYGKHSAGQSEIDQAISSLTAILTYCGEPV